MRFILSVLLILLLSALAEYFLPWWSLAIIAFIIGYAMKLSAAKAFLAGFTAIALLWLGVVLWRDIPNEHILSGRMAKVFSLPSSPFFIAATILVGGLAGGLSAWSGTHFRRMIANEKGLEK